MTKSFFLSTLLMICLQGSSQDFYIGVMTGAGDIHFRRVSDEENTAGYRTPGAGITVEFSPYYSLLYLTSGAEFKWNSLGSGLTVPLTFRVEPGKKVRPFAEGGVCYNIVLNDIQDPFRLRNDFSALLRLGILIPFKEKFGIEVSYFNQYGLSTALEEDILLPLDQTDSEKYKRMEQGFTLRLRYQLY